MKTYKVTFFEQNLEIYSVATFHNFANQHDFAKFIAIQIHTMELLPMVKCFQNDKDITIEFNILLKSYLKNFKSMKDVEKIKVPKKETIKSYHLHQ